MALGAAEAANAALAELSRLRHDGAERTVERLQRYYRDRLAEIDNGQESRRLLLKLMDAERARVRALRHEGRINDRVVAELDRLLELRKSTLTGGDRSA